jgi:hypothetical protein
MPEGMFGGGGAKETFCVEDDGRSFVESRISERVARKSGPKELRVASGTGRDVLESGWGTAKAGGRADGSHEGGGRIRRGRGE